MIAVVDYRMGNLKSVERGLRAVGADARITSDAGEIAAADAVVLPGVGAFADAMASMKALGEDAAILSAIADGKPFLGICLGLHLLFTDGVEGAPEGGTVAGLGLVPGVVRRMPNEDAAGNAYKVPHVGWNSVEAPATGGEGEGAPCSNSPRFVEIPTGDFESCAPPSIARQVPLGRTARGITPRTHAGDSNLAEERMGRGLFSGIPEGEHFYFTHSYIAPDSEYTIATTEHSVRFPSAVALSDRVFGVQFHPEKSSDAGAKVLANFVRIVDSVGR